MKHSNKRAERLLEAADGMTTEEAEKYLRYGPEMEEFVVSIDESFNILKDTMPEGVCKRSAIGFFLTEDSRAKNLLSKLNREG